jgi:hypothetical protein
MKGYMRERSGAWELRVYAGRDPVTGRKRYLRRTVRGGKREANRVLAAMIVEADEHSAPRQGTLAKLLEEWSAYAEQGLQPKDGAGDPAVPRHRRHPPPRTRRGVVHGRNGLVEKDTKTHTYREVALDPTAVKLLTINHADCNQAARASGAGLRTSGLCSPTSLTGVGRGGPTWSPTPSCASASGPASQSAAARPERSERRATRTLLGLVSAG